MISIVSVIQTALTAVNFLLHMPTVLGRHEYVVQGYHIQKALPHSLLGNFQISNIDQDFHEIVCILQTAGCQI